MKHALTGAALILFAYHCIEIWFNLHSSIRHYVFHLGMVLIVCALCWSAEIAESDEGSAKRPSIRIGQAALIALAILTAAATAYIYLHATRLELSQPFLGNADFAAGIVFLFAIAVLTWRIWGAVLTVLCVLGGLYFWQGYLLPEPWKAPEAESFITLSYLTGLGTTRGIFNYIPVSADTIILLIVYGGLLGWLRIIDMFGQLGNAIGRLVRGGVAYSAVVASSLIGMVTGQAVSNIALSGSMTIPTMMRRGFSAEKAGAIECLASNGSQLLPPIMGLGAFLMAAILGIPYIEIAKAAIFPAVLYVLILFTSLRALIQGTSEIKEEEEPVDWRLTLSVLPSFALSLGVIILLLSQHYSGGMAGVYGIAVLLASSFLRPAEYRPHLRDILEGLVSGVVNAAKLALVLAAIGVLVQTMTTTGLGFLLGRLMLEWSGGDLVVGLTLGMIFCLVIGMGLPTPAAYSVIAIVVVPVLIDIGVEDLAAHFFGFYFGIFSSISPPVAVGILTAVRISGARFMSTAVECLKLGCLGFLLPFFMVAFPGLLDFPHIDLDIVFAACLLLVATYMAGCAFYGDLLGRLSPWERGLLALGPVGCIAFMFSPDIWVPTVTIVGFLTIVARRWFIRRCDRFGGPKESPQL